MLREKAGRNLMGVLTILVLAAPASAQWIRLGKFKGV